MQHYNNLSEDVALEIFLHAIEEDGVTMCINQGPWLLGHVCRSWRQFVNSSPSLWSTIEVNFTDLYHREIDGVLALLNAALSRSANLSLHISFTSSFICDEQSLVVLGALLRHSPRWQTAKLYLSPDMLYEVGGLRPTFTRLSQLQFGVLWAQENWMVRIKRLPVLLFQETPILHTVLLKGIPAQYVRLHWGQLTTLTHIGDMDSEMSVLRWTPNLTSFSAEYSFSSYLLPPISGPAPAVRLPHLQEISLWGSTIGDLERVKFELPSLQSARIDVGGDPVAGSLECVQQLIISTSALRTLDLNGIALACGAQIMEILAAVDGTLELLRLGHRVERCGKAAVASSRTFIPAFVAALTNTPARKCLLPRLRDVRFDIRSSNVELDMEWGSIRRMWESRRQPEEGYGVGGGRHLFGVVRLDVMYFADRRCAMRDGVLIIMSLIFEGLDGGDFEGLDIWGRQGLDGGDLYAESTAA